MGRITIPICTQMVASAGTFSGCLNSILNCYQNIVKRANYANEFVKFLNYPFAMQEGKREVSRKPHIFEFRTVSFTSLEVKQMFFGM